MVYANSKSCENMLDLLPLPGLEPVALKLAPRVSLDGVKSALENVRFVQSATVDHAKRVATVVMDIAALGGKSRDAAVADIVKALAAAGVEAVEETYQQKPLTYGKSEWLIFGAVGAATTATAYAFLQSRVSIIPAIV